MASYYVWSGATGSANGTTWANAYTTLTSAYSGKVAGDVFYVAHDHAESTAGNVTLTSAGTITTPSKVICANRSGSVPPVSADRRTTAQVVTSADFNLTLGGTTHFDGIIFRAGSGSTSFCFLVLGAATSGISLRFDNCSLRLGIAGSGSNIMVGGSGSALGATQVELNNTTLSFAHIDHSFSVAGRVKWRNTPSALLGTIPTILFISVSLRGGSVEAIGVDLSAAGSGKTICGTGTSTGFSYKLVDCKLNASVTKVQSQVAPGYPTVDFIRSGASGNNYTVFRQDVAATLSEETTIVRTTGGATDGTQKISWKVVSSVTNNFSLPFECPPIAIWNDTTGSAKTATIECISSAIMKDDECWVELEYLGDAASPQGSFVNDAKTDLLATGVNQTTSAEAWGGSTAAFKLAVTFTAQQKGWIYARVKVAKVSSTVYVDPLITLT